MTSIKHKGIIIISAVALIAAIWILRVNDVASRFPAKSIETYHQGETVRYSSVSDGTEGGSIDAQVDIVPGELEIQTIDNNYYISMKMDITNAGDSVLNTARLARYFLIASAYNGLNSNVMFKDDIPMIEPGDTDTLEVYMAAGIGTVGRNNVDAFLDDEFYLIIQQYPKEVRLIYER